VFRIFKVSRYVKGINLLVDTMNHSFHDILMIICLFIVMVLTFSTMIFYWEKGSNWDSRGWDQRFKSLII
jgi:Na+/alanine symporter